MPLRATLDWSYELLSEPERLVLRRLAVFPGGFTLEAASNVVTSAEIAASDECRSDDRPGALHFHDLPDGTHRPRCGSGPGRPIGQGPTQSNGMCLAEFSVYSNLKPCASTDRIVDLPQVTSCGPGPVSLPGAFISCGYFPGGLVGPMIALAQALTLPTISTPQWPRSGAISYVILARSMPRLCRPPAKHSLTQPGKPPVRPPMIAGSASICRSSA